MPLGFMKTHASQIKQLLTGQLSNLCADFTKLHVMLSLDSCLLGNKATYVQISRYFT